MKGAELADEGVEALCAALPQMNLSELHIEMNHITARGAKVSGISSAVTDRGSCHFFSGGMWAP